MSSGVEQEKEKPSSTGGLPLRSLRHWPIRYYLILLVVLVCFGRLISRLSYSSNDLVSHHGEQPAANVPRPHTVSPSAMASPAQGSFNPRDIAALMARYYELLARMRYFPSSAIKYPPHSPPIDIAFAQSLGLEPQVIELLQILPYVEGYRNEDEFILGGSFADFRKKGVLSQSRDPAFAEPEGDFDSENEQYVRPWVLVLNECGNHGSIMYLDTRTS